MSDFELVLDYTVPIKTVSALSANGSHGSHHRITKARREVRQDVADMVMRGRHSPPTGRVDIHVTLHQRTKGRRDPDGLAGVAKPVIDGLVTAGLLEDDGHKYVASVRLAVVAGVTDVPKGNHTLIVTITDAEELDAA